jgi:hypothetical protein
MRTEFLSWKNLKESLGRPKRRWEDNFKTDIKGIGFEGTDWIHVFQ